MVKHIPFQVLQEMFSDTVDIPLKGWVGLKFSCFKPIFTTHTFLSIDNITNIGNVMLNATNEQQALHLHKVITDVCFAQIFFKWMQETLHFLKK